MLSVEVILRISNLGLCHFPVMQGRGRLCDHLGKTDTAVLCAAGLIQSVSSTKCIFDLGYFQLVWFYWIITHRKHRSIHVEKVGKKRTENKDECRERQHVPQGREQKPDYSPLSW
jgi:hypothetical protein